MTSLPNRVEIVEVGPRDGLQFENQFVQTENKLEWIEKLINAGLSRIEVTSFVSPKRVPQLADHEALLKQLPKNSKVRFSALIPNEQGFEKIIGSRLNEIAVFTAASEAFTQKNIHCSIKESLERFSPVINAAKKQQLKVRAYISCVLGCPYEGVISPSQVGSVAKSLYELGCDEISLGDTIGVGTPLNTQKLLTTVMEIVPVERIAVHFHDTYGQALANILMALQMGVQIIDTSVSGLGGCPYAKGASGNVATEDVVYLLHGMGISTGIDLEKLVAAGEYICKILNRDTTSKVARAIIANSRNDGV